MTTLREAAQQALEAMTSRDGDSWTRRFARDRAIEALEAALAEPVQQGCEHCNQPLYAAVKCRVCGRVTSAEPVQESAICDECGKSKHDGWALYCVKCVEPMFAPPQRKPLTETSAERTLKRLGYTDCGGEFWKPPLGAPAAPVQEPVQDGKCKHCVDGCPACDARKLPVQEPVAWTYEWKHRFHGGSLNVSRARWPESHLWIETPLYASPPRKPLTEEEILRIKGQFRGTLDVQFVNFTRAVERAHGIKE